MKIGDLVHHRRDEYRDDWGIGMIVDRCEAGACESLLRFPLKHAHWVIHFPNRVHPRAMAAFVHSGPRPGREDKFKWVEVE